MQTFHPGATTGRNRPLKDILSGEKQHLSNQKMMEAKETTKAVCVLLRHDRRLEGCGYGSPLRFPAHSECLFYLYLLTILSLCALTHTHCSGQVNSLKKGL